MDDEERERPLTAHQKFLIGNAGDRLCSVAEETDEPDHQTVALDVIEDVMRDLRAVLAELEANQ